MPLFDFVCQDGHRTEELVSADTEAVLCRCGLEARKVFLSPPKISWLALGAQKHASPEAIARFDKLHQQRKAKEERCYRDNGDYGPAAGAD